jgi:hypothetical protein
MPRSQGTSVIELEDPSSTSVSVGVRPATVHVGVADSTRGPGEQLSSVDIRPPFFGAAWKVLDQLIELALERTGVVGSTIHEILPSGSCLGMASLPVQSGGADHMASGLDHGVDGLSSPSTLGAVNSIRTTLWPARCTA